MRCGATGSDKGKAGKEEVSHIDPRERGHQMHGGPWGGTRLGRARLGGSLARAVIGVFMAKARRG